MQFFKRDFHYVFKAWILVLLQLDHILCLDVLYLSWYLYIMCCMWVNHDDYRYQYKSAQHQVPQETWFLGAHGPICPREPLSEPILLRQPGFQNLSPFVARNDVLIPYFLRNLRVTLFFMNVTESHSFLVQVTPCWQIFYDHSLVGWTNVSMKMFPRHMPTPQLTSKPKLSQSMEYDYGV